MKGSNYSNCNNDRNFMFENFTVRKKSVNINTCKLQDYEKDVYVNFNIVNFSSFPKPQTFEHAKIYSYHIPCSKLENYLKLTENYYEFV